MTVTRPAADGPPAAPSAWAPLRIGVFRALWLASLISVTGTWFQTVGAQWLLVHRPHASLLVSLVQAASALPFVFFGLFGGVLADTLDRARLLFRVQAGLAVLGALLAALTFAGQMPPALLLLLLFLLGSGVVLATPAYQSLLPDLVPRAQLPAASALNAMSMNVARAVGPAIAGVVIAQVGVGAAFSLAALGSLCFALATALWRPPAAPTSSPEPFLAALRAGSRYVINAPAVRRIMLRAAMFLVPASSLFALLPVVAAGPLRLGSGGYGLLLGALGIGAVSGALALPLIRSRLSSDAMVTLASVVYVVGLAGIAVLRQVVPVLLLLLPMGVAWVVVLSNINATLQLFLPAWVRGRSLAVYQMVLFGGQAVGAVVFGVLAAAVGLVPALLSAAALAAVGAATVRIWPFIETSGMDRSTVIYWPEPQLAANVDPSGRAVLVTVAYRVSPADEPGFLEAMALVRRSRLRTGAVSWGLYREADDPPSFLELFAVPSWEEHQRQHHERLTGADRDFEQRAADLSQPAPQPCHLISVDVSRAPSG